ncbi:hypothetical protein QQ045_027804 [Rhodiola kirilowii]
METPTLYNLDVPIMDEYHREEMENLEMVAVQNLQEENAIPRYVWDHPDFEDSSAWETNQPADEYMGGNFGQPNLHESLGVASEFDSKELAIHAVRKWLIMNRVEYVDTDEIDGEYIQVNCVFWAFAECIHAFKHCRPILSIDGTHLYGKYYAKLLVACSLDANNGVLPVAFALVESENTSSWSWFMSCIREGVTSRRGLCVVSDRHGGIMATTNEPQWSPPNAYHRICVHHFKSNFNTKVAYAKKEYKFAAQYEELMNLLKDRPDVRNWLRNVDPHLWSLAMDTDGMRWGSMTTNASESFNNVLKHGRDLPISALVMFTFKQLNKYFHSRRYRYDNTESAFAPKVHERLEVLRERAQFHRVVHFNPSQGIYRVTTGIKHHMWRVCIPEKICSCGKWMTLHIPCSHAIVVCKFTNREYSDYVPHEYTLEAYNMTWSYHFSPLPHSDFWEPYVGLPHKPNPHFKRTKVGRNLTRRRHTEMDQRDVGQSSTQGEASSSQPQAEFKGANYANKLIITEGLVPSPMQAKSNIRGFSLAFEVAARSKKRITRHVSEVAARSKKMLCTETEIQQDEHKKKILLMTTLSSAVHSPLTVKNLLSRPAIRIILLTLRNI